MTVYLIDWKLDVDLKSLLNSAFISLKGSAKHSEFLREMNVYYSGKVVSQELVIVRKPL